MSVHQKLTIPHACNAHLHIIDPAFPNDGKAAAQIATSFCSFSRSWRAMSLVNNSDEIPITIPRTMMTTRLRKESILCSALFFIVLREPDVPCVLRIVPESYLRGVSCEVTICR